MSVASGFARARRFVKPIVSHGRGDLVLLEFLERGRTLAAWCPDDELFTLSRELILDRAYERHGLALSDGAKTVVDAGAHVGLFSLQAAQWADRVVSLEASRVNFHILSMNVDRNGLENVEARHAALWREPTEDLQLRRAGHTGGGVVTDLQPVAGPGDAEGRRGLERVQGVTLDDLIDELGTIDLLKIDVEGAEYDVLGGCRQLGAVRQIAGEMHLEGPADRQRLEALVAGLRSEGFAVWTVSERELFSTASLLRLGRNRAALPGRRLVKALAAAYYVAPVEKPIRAPGSTYELPLLVARRDGQ